MEAWFWSCQRKCSLLCLASSVLIVKEAVVPLASRFCNVALKAIFTSSTCFFSFSNNSVSQVLPSNKSPSAQSRWNRCCSLHLNPDWYQGQTKGSETCPWAVASVQADDKDGCRNRKKRARYKNIWEVKLVVLGDWLVVRGRKWEKGNC